MDFKQIQTIIKEFEESSLTILEIEKDGFKLRLSKNNDTVFVNKQNDEVKDTLQTEEPANVPFPESTVTEVKSPLVGTFYTSSGPGEEPFITVGSNVVVGQKLCIIEAMKIMNEITSPISGTVTRIIPQNGAAVGYDQVLVTIA